MTNNVSIRVACISKELKEFLDRRFKRGAQIVPELGNLLEEIAPLPECNGKESTKHNSTYKKKSLNPRMKFMSVCMKPISKQGMGKDMSSCSIMWKDMSEYDKSKYA